MDTIDYYNQNAEKYVDETLGANMGELYEPFLFLLPSGGKILDAGCGSGRDSRYFINKGYEVVAFDGSSELVKLSSEILGQEVLHLTFDEIDFREEFDGIWACASLVHVQKKEIDGVIGKLNKGLKKGGTFYLSFKYGEKEEIRKGRFFSDYTETSFNTLIGNNPTLETLKTWVSRDVRPGRKNDKWLNVILRKR